MDYFSLSERKEQMLDRQNAVDNNLASKSYNIQLLRGLAIVAVVLIHNAPRGLPQVFIRPFINFSVGLFLFLSGMLSNADRWHHRKRIVKILIPYVLWTLIYSSMRTIQTPGKLTIQFIKSFITASGAAVMYYVFVYCQFTLLIPIIDKLVKSRYKYLGFLIAPLEIIFMRLLPLMSGYEMNPYISIIMRVSCLGWFTYLYLGYHMGNGMLEIKSSTKRLWIVLIVTIVLQMFGGYWYWTMGNPNCGTQLKLSFLFIGAVFVMLAFRFAENYTVQRNKIINIMKYIGDISFGIYFSHLAVMMVLRHIPFFFECRFFPTEWNNYFGS